MRQSLLSALFAGVLACLPYAVAAQPGADGAARRTDAAREASPLLREVFAAIARNDWQAARERVRDARGPVPVKLVEWLYLRRGSGATFDDYVNFLRANGDWPDADRLRRRAEDAIDSRASAGDVLAWFARHPPRSGDGGLRYAKALFDAGRRPQAAAVLRQAWVERDFSPAAFREIRTQYAQHLRTEDHVRRLDALLWAGRTQSAQAMLPLVPEGERALAEARLGLSALRGGTDRLLARVPARLADDPGLAYERARWRRLKQQPGALDLLDRPRDKLGPRPDKWWTERRVHAQDLLERGYISEAYRLVARHGIPPGGADHAEAEWLAGWIATRLLRDPKEGYPHFARTYEAVNFPISRARFAYWAGRAATAAGDRDGGARWYRAAAQHPETFYGQLAIEQAGDPALARFPADPKPTANERTRFNARELTAAARLLAANDRTDDLLPFVQRLLDIAESPGERVLALDLVAELGRTELQVRAAKLSSQQGRTFYGHAYPTPFRARSEFGVEPALLLAIARQESEFDTEAVSPAGARGLMQLMPATAQDVARSLGLGWRPQALTGDPAYNVRLGDAYLGGLLERYGGSYVLAVAAYNAGPSRVVRWLGIYGDPRGGDVDTIDWIESIPFAETRNYVQRVLEGVAVYRHRLGPERTTLRLQRDLARGGRGDDRS